ncbi:MAG TPA: bifunctional nuclease domain-containing protein [Egibacteraceae bacterium]|nr:bifunctional nuclease domain-containing protein [Egibacteraceae bacterium]
MAFALQQVELPRPLTHQLTASLLEAAGARVKATHITRLAEHAFYATVTLQTPAGERQVDARPPAP